MKHPARKRKRHSGYERYWRRCAGPPRPELADYRWADERKEERRNGRATKRQIAKWWEAIPKQLREDE